MYYLSLIIAVVSGILYHVTQKSIGHEVNPLVSLMATYAVALVFTFIFYRFDHDFSVIVKEVRQLNWASYLLGIIIVGLELGILMAYRNGWDIGKLSLINNIAIAFVLIPIGMIFFSEQMTVKTIIGMVVTVAGLVLIKI